MEQLGIGNKINSNTGDDRNHFPVAHRNLPHTSAKLNWNDNLKLVIIIQKSNSNSQKLDDSHNFLPCHGKKVKKKTPGQPQLLPFFHFASDSRLPSSNATRWPSTPRWRPWRNPPVGPWPNSCWRMPKEGPSDPRSPRSKWWGLELWVDFCWIFCWNIVWNCLITVWFTCFCDMLVTYSMVTWNIRSFVGSGKCIFCASLRRDFSGVLRLQLWSICINLQVFGHAEQNTLL